MAKVLSLASYRFLPARVGGQKNVAIFYKYLSRWVPLVCVTTANNDTAAAEGYEVLNVLSNSAVRYMDPRNIFLLRKLIRQRGFTHLMLEHPYYGWLGVILKWICGVKLVIHSHNIEGTRWKSLGKWWWRILWSYEKWTHRIADYTLFITDEDKDYGIARWGLDPIRCMTLPYGLERDSIPEASDVIASRTAVRERHGLAPDPVILLFNGAFDYAPNRDALQYILNDINPLLRQVAGFSYHIIICGKDIPAQLLGGIYPNVTFAGFVDDIDEYLRAADVFLNPIVEGGGIKTKLVEALGNNLTAVSVVNGAAGVSPALCGGKLLICENHDWPRFAALVMEASRSKLDMPQAFFEHFYWGVSTQKAAAFIEGK